jgi:hypothetical protein
MNNYYFSKNEYYFLMLENYIIFHHLLQYCDMCSEIIQSVAYDNYDDDFQHANFIFSQNQVFFFHHFIAIGIVQQHRAQVTTYDHTNRCN